MNKIFEMSNVGANYENTALETHLQYAERTQSDIRFDQLPEKSPGGTLIASYRDQQDRLHTIFSEPTHSLIIGATRCGKTTGVVLPNLFAIAMQKNPPSFLATDPKGEITRACFHACLSNGVMPIIFNLRDEKKSEAWNALLQTYKWYQEAHELLRQVEAYKEDDKYYAVFKGTVYTSEKELHRHLEAERDILLYTVYQAIDDICFKTIPIKSSDPYWDTSARSALQAILYGMLEDSRPETVDNRTLITEDTFSFRTAMDIFASFGAGSGNSSNSVDNGFFTSRPVESKARQLAQNSILVEALTTRACIKSCFEAGMSAKKEYVTKLLTSCNSIDLEMLADESTPVAIFVIYRDEVRTSYDTVRDFIVAVKDKLIEVADESQNQRLSRPFIFMLDEFGNLPTITDFDTAISACGGRNIWFQIVLQSYAQLDNNYGKDAAQIIRDNLNLHMFLGTNNIATASAFSAECGKRTIVSPRCIFAGDKETITAPYLEEVAVVPVSVLNTMDIGECYVTMLKGKSVIHSHLERSYLCKEFNLPKMNLKDYHPSVNVFDKRYVYSPDDKETETNPGRRNKPNWSMFF